MLQAIAAPYSDLVHRRHRSKRSCSVSPRTLPVSLTTSPPENRSKQSAVGDALRHASIKKQKLDDVFSADLRKSLPHLMVSIQNFFFVFFGGTETEDSLLHDRVITT